MQQTGEGDDRLPRGQRTGGLVGLALGIIVLVQANPATAGNEPGWGIPSDKAAGEFKYTNRLVNSRNPYLLLHAHNPVDWYPWGPEAFDKAIRENKPIFLSVGYSTCYWCHIAERTIYSNPEIAELMNEWFVNVKVDREQRPDVDRIYMLATHLTTGRGGWPNNVFLTPDLKPFFAGSYFPPKDDAARGPGFPTVLAALRKLWMEDRDRVLNAAESLTAAMQRVRQAMTEQRQVPVDPETWLTRARESLLALLDEDFGGFRNSRSVVKFPQAPNLELLLTAARTSDNDARNALATTLDAMASGGIRDHLAGGFHRYATEPTWSIPHFEKMLYDNAQLLKLYADAYELTGNEFYRQVALETGEYLGREMRAPEGGFYTAQDSQVRGVEGASYVWTTGEIRSILGSRAAARFLDTYQLAPMPRIDAPGVPTHSDPAGEQTGVLRIHLRISDTPQPTGTANAVEALTTFAPERAKLLSARNRRVQPARDDKIITGLNGLAIQAFADSGRLLEQAEFIEFARNAGERIWTVAFDRKTHTLKHEIFLGHAQTPGYLQDYASLGRGFVALYRATGNKIWRDRAEVLAQIIITRFVRPDGSVSTTADDRNLLFPVDDGEDGDIPSGTTVAIELLLQLAVETANDSYGATAARIARSRSGVIAEHPDSWPTAVAVLNRNPLPPAARVAAVQAPGKSAGPIRGGFRIPESADHVSVSAVVQSATDEPTVVITLKIDDGYHVNANPASLDYLIPTSLTFDQLKPSKVQYPTPTPFKPDFAPEPIDVYEGTVSLVATFPKGSLKEIGTIEGKVTAQACDVRICLPPSEIPIEFATEN